MAPPMPKVEVAFGFGPYDPEPLAMDWVDITSDVMEIHTVRGRQAEFENFTAGTCSIILYDENRTYDPLNTAVGSWGLYGVLKANTPIRITATIDSTTYPVWRGYTDEWRVEYREGGSSAEVILNGTDAFKVLAERRYPDPLLAALDDIGRPDSWYTCDSIDGNALVNVGTVGRNGVILQSVETTDALSLSSDGAVRLPALKGPAAGIDPYVASIEMPITLDARDNLTAGGTWTISLLMRAVTRDPVTLFATRVPGLAYAEQLSMAALGVSPAGNANWCTFLLDYGGGGFLGNTAQIDIGDGAVHHLVLTRDSTVARLYVDGVLAASDTDGAVTGAYDAGGGQHQLGRSPAYPDQGGSVVIDELMGWADRALDATEVAALYEALTVPGTSIVPTGTAIGAVLDDIGWLSGLRVINNGETLVQPPARPRDVTVLELLHNYATCEGGARLFVDRSGRVVFHDRDRFLTHEWETDLQYEFTDVDRDTTPTDVGILDGTLRLSLDDKRTFDGAQVTRVGGLTRTAGSTTPARTWSATDLYLASDVQAQSLASWVTFRYGTAQPRSDAWQVDGEVLPEDWPTLLGLEISARIRHELTPGGVGSAIELDQSVSMIEHHITPERWLITLNGTPVDPNADAYFLWAETETADDDNGWADTDGDPEGGYWG